MNKYVEEIIQVLKGKVKLPLEKIESLIEIPPEEKFGDYAFPCHLLSKELKKPPQEIASRISSELKPEKLIEEIYPLGPYINFKVNRKKFAESILQEIYERAGKVGLASSGLGVSPELSVALKIKGMAKLALCAAYAALQRTESRGCHAREDFEARNDRDWLKRTLATWKEGSDLPVLNYEPFSKVMELPPGDRGYGSCKIIGCDDDITGD